MSEISSNLLAIQCSILRRPCRPWLAGPSKLGRAAVAAKVHGHSGVPSGHSPAEPEAHVHAERRTYENTPAVEDDIVSDAYDWADSSAMAPEAVQGMLVDATPADPPAERPLSGWVLAASVLLAVRLGRSASESARFDMAHLQREVEQAWEARSEALRRSRAADPEAAAAAEARMALARERAIAAQREREERDAALLRAAERERQRAQAAAAAERAAFEAQEARMAAELEQRTLQERRLLQQAAERARLAAEQRRKEAEAAAAAAEAERRAAEEAEARRREEERAEREAEKRALRRLQHKYAVRLLGSAEVARPPKGAMTDERLPKEAVVVVKLTVGSALGGEAEPTRHLYASVDAAREAVDELAARACSAGAQLYGSSVRLQSMAGQGALQDMGEVELQHWLRTAAVRAAFTGAAHLRALLDAHAAQPQQHQQCSFEVRTERGVLPAEHPQRVDARLAAAISALQREDEASATSVITSYMADEEEAIRKDGGGCVREHAGEALALAHFLDETWAQRPARRIEASPWYEAAGALAQRLLGQHTRSAPKDSLGPVSRVVGAVLGPDHAVAQMLRAAAEANLSPATLTALRERERIQQAELAAALLEEEWPDEAEAAAARAAAREASTPVPERVWALRNVGATLALGGPGERARARQMLEKAALLKAEWVGGSRHPGVLPELDALGALLEANEEWQEDASAVRARMLGILLEVADRYVSLGESASACALLEAAMREYEEVVGLKHPSVKACFRCAEQLLSNLPEDQREKVSGARRAVPSFVQKVIAAFNEEPAVQRVGEVRSKAEVYNEGGLAPLPILA